MVLRRQYVIVTSQFGPEGLFLFLALGNIHRPPTKSQTRREKAGQRTRKGLQGSRTEIMCWNPRGNDQQYF